jgi:hypothetical protein
LTSRDPLAEYVLTPCEDPDVPGVPIGYPFQLDDGQLEKALNDMLGAKANWPVSTTSLHCCPS